MKIFSICTLLLIIISYTLKSQNTELTNKIDLELIKGNYLQVITLTNDYLSRDTNAVFLYKNALANRLSYNYNIALKQSSRLIRLEPDNVDFKLEHCRNLINVNLLKDAQTILEHIFFESDTTLIQAGILLGKIYDHFDNDTQSSKVYEQLCILDSTNTYFLYNYAIAITNLKKGKDAIPILKKVLLIDSTHINGRYLLFRIYIALDQYDIAIAQIDSIKQITPNNYKPYYELAQYNFGKSFNYRAIPEYKKAIELGYTEDDAWHSIGKCYYGIKKYREAIPYLKHSSSPEIIDSKLLSTIGSCYLKLNNIDSATIFFEKAYVSSMPDPSFLEEYYTAKASVYLKNNDYNNAIKCYETLILQVDALRWGVYYKDMAVEHLVSIYTELNEYDKAIALCQESLVNISKTIDAKRFNYYTQQIKKLQEEIFFRGD